MNLKQKKMNCFNDTQIQHYIDGEITTTELKLYEAHLKKCKVCKQKTIEQKENRDFVLKQFELISIPKAQEETSVPKYNTEIKKPIIKRMIYIVSAASLIIFAYFLSTNNETKTNLTPVNNSFEFDANSSITNQDFEISITDENGETISYYIK